MAKILLIDDDELVRYALQRYLNKMGHEVVELSSGLHVNETITDELPDIVVTDIIMPNVEGIEVTLQVRNNFPDLPIIAMSGGGRSGAEGYLESAQAFGVQATLAKPFEEEKLLELITTLLE